MSHRILVTGGAGFIGSHLVEQLLARGDEVVVLDDLSSGNRDRLAPEVQLVIGDLADRQLLKSALQGVNKILHHAAIPSVPASVADPIGSARVNLTGTIHLIEEATIAGIERIVFASSSAVYGEGSAEPVHEELLCRPLSPYGIHKLTAEHLLRVASLSGGPDSVSLRYFNVYGPRQSAQSDYAAAIPKFIESCRHGQVPKIFGTGEQTRDFIHVEDIARANLVMLDAQQNWQGESYNLATGQATRIVDLAQAVMRQFQLTTAPHFAPARAGDILHSVANIQKLNQALAERKVDWTPQFNLDSALELQCTASNV